MLIDALAELRRQGLDAELVLAGDGELRSAIEQRSAQSGVADLVRITGWISGATVREEINAARALVLSSFAEGLPVVLMEAMACQRPGDRPRVLPAFPNWCATGRTAGSWRPAMRWSWPRPCDSVLRLALHSCKQWEWQPGRGRLERHDVDRSALQLKQVFASLGGTTA